ncbi:MAG: hypothetical protein ACREAZ_13425 [Nitrososphaera sp.]
MKRILITLSENGKTKRTNLAGKTGLNYIVCVRYINLMKILGWIKVVTHDESEYVSVTHVGKQIIGALSNFLDGRYADHIDHSAPTNVNDPDSRSTLIIPALKDGVKNQD